MYGFDLKEQSRISRRSALMGKAGYQTDYPMIWQGDFIDEIESAGIRRPNAYEMFEHANCVGCLKAGWQHWYIVYIFRRDIYDEVADFEEEVNHALHKNWKGEPVFLNDRREFFDDMIICGIKGTEHLPPEKFWIDAKKMVIAKKANIPLEQMDIFAQEDQGVCLDCIA